MQNNQNELVIDEVLTLEIDDLDQKELTTKTEEEMEEVQRINNTFFREKIVPDLLRKCIVCQCRMPEFMQRKERQRQLLNIPPQQYRPSLEQQDVDANKFCVATRSHDEKIYGVAAIVRECTQCHSLSFWGDSEIMIRLIAEITTNAINNEQGANEDDAVPKGAATEEHDIQGVLFEDVSGASAANKEQPEE